MPASSTRPILPSLSQQLRTTKLICSPYRPVKTSARPQGCLCATASEESIVSSFKDFFKPFLPDPGLARKQASTPPTGAEANTQTNTGEADPLTTSKPPNPEDFTGPASGEAVAAQTSPDVVSNTMQPSEMPSAPDTATASTPPTAAEANSQTSTGSADPLTTSRPPDPRNFSGPASGNPSAVESSDVVSSAPSTNEISSIAEATSSAESPGLPTRSASETAEAMASQATTTSGAVDSAPSAGSGILQETAASSSDTAAQAASANSGNDASFLSSLEDAKNGLFDNFKDATSSAAQSVEGLTGDLREQAGDASAGLSQQLEAISDELGKQLTGLTDAAGDSLEGVSTQVEAVRGAASGAAGNVLSQVLESVNATLQGLPVPVREALTEIARPVSKALTNPQVASSLLAIAVAIPTVSYISDRFGGYAGQLPAQDAQKMLEEQNSLLLDIRTDDSRERSGTPDLRYGARTRGVALPLVRMSKRSGTQVVKAEFLPFQLAAIVVQGLIKVNASTKIIVLDDSETRPIKLARALADIGYDAYVLQGGINGWVSSGLPVKESIDYDATALDSINDTLRGRVLPWLRDPLLAFLTISLAVTSAAAIYDIHSTLEFVGVYAIIATAGLIPVNYDSLEDAKEDILGPFIPVASFVLNLFPKTSPEATAEQADFEGEEGNERTRAKPVSAEIVDDNYPMYQKGDSRQESEGAGSKA